MNGRWMMLYNQNRRLTVCILHEPVMNTACYIIRVFNMLINLLKTKINYTAIIIALINIRMSALRMIKSRLTPW